MKRRVGGGTVAAAILLILLLGLVRSVEAAEFYVSPTGSSSGDGSMASPWDVQTAFYHPSVVQPGDTIWVRGGTYPVIRLRSFLRGTESAPILVRQMPGERATFDTGYGGVFYIYGAYAWYCDFEVMSSSPVRWSDDPGTCPRGQNIYLAPNSGHVPGIKLINLITHDTGNNIGFWEPCIDSELYGNLIYYNGYDASDRGHGHGIYTQNSTGLKTIRRNIIWGTYGHGIQIYGASGPRSNYLIEGNIIFGTGIPSTRTGASSLIKNTGGVRGYSQVFRNNHFFRGEEGSSYMVDLTNNEGVTFVDNHVVGRECYIPGVGWVAYPKIVLSPQETTFLDISGNTFVGEVSALYDMAPWPDNYLNALYYPDDGNRIFLLVNPYFDGRAILVVWNFEVDPAVAVDLSGLGVPPGTPFEIRDAENVFGPPVATGVYDGSTVSLPMNQTELPPVIGTPHDAMEHTPPDFGVFYVRADPDAVVNLPPVVDSAATAMPNPVTLPDTSALSVTASDPDSGPSALTCTWSVTAGPAGAGFSPNGTTDADATTASFTADGSYEIEVVVSDGEDTATSTVTVQVDPEPNQAPVIDTPASATPSPAYTHQTITLDVTAHDPDSGPGSLGYRWEQLGGPTTPLSDPNTKSPTVTPTVPGTYDWRVFVDDGEDEVTSDVSVEVNPSPDLNGDGTVDLLDFYLLRQAFGSSNPAADLDENGTVDLLDFYILRQNFGPFGS